MPYHPISCDFHSELELLALHRTVCPIVYKNEEGREEKVESFINDLFTREGEEFLLLPDGREIRLDRLVSVNGLEFAKYC
jgi:transcriptional antiterminator Rof (Rho-off)